MQSNEKLGITALYCRVSRDDGTEKESVNAELKMQENAEEIM